MKKNIPVKGNNVPVNVKNKTVSSKNKTGTGASKRKSFDPIDKTGSAMKKKMKVKNDVATSSSNYNRNLVKGASSLNNIRVPKNSVSKKSKKSKKKLSGVHSKVF